MDTEIAKRMVIKAPENFNKEIDPFYGSYGNYTSKWDVIPNGKRVKRKKK